MMIRKILMVTTLCLVANLAAATDVAGPVVRIAKFDGDRAAALSYTFDDNLRDQYTLAVPMLNEVGFKGTFFVIPSRTAETSEEGRKKDEATRAWGGISWPELKEMAAQGHEISSHTWSHRNMQKMPVDEVDAELRKAYDAIKTRIGQPPLTLAFPFNASTPEVKDAALKYHVAYRAYQASTGGKSTVESLNAWADNQVKNNTWGVMMTHAVAKGYAALSDPEIFRTHLKYVQSRNHDIWVDTFANIARYEKERDEAKLSVTADKKQLICTLNSTLDAQIYDMPLTLVIDTSGVASAHAERAGQVLPVRVENGHILVQVKPAAQPIVVTWK